jgi:ribosomal protein S18 acetylase RimI-like enzyme
MLIRLYQPADLPRLKAITVEAFQNVSIDYGIEREFGPINGHDWQWRKARHIDDDAARDPAGIFVAVVGGLHAPREEAVGGPHAPREESISRSEMPTEIVGYITTRQDREAGIGYIPNLAIVPEYRGAGLGRQLIEHALAHFRAAGLTHAKIETLANNDVGNHLYRSLGFREVARQIHFVAKLDRPIPDGID